MRATDLRRRRSFSLGAGVGFALLATCSTPEQICMLIGAESQVAVDLSALAPKITGPSHAEVCRGGLHLVRRSGARTPGDMDRARPAPGLSGGSSTTPVSVTVTADATGHVVFRRSVVTPVHKVQPNGPNCDPTVYRAYVAALHGGTLTSRLPG